MRSPRAFNVSTTRTVPSTAGPSSSDVRRTAIEPEWLGLSFKNISVATTKEAIEDFISAAPRPYNWPWGRGGGKGAECPSASGPVGPRGVGPAKPTGGADAPRRAQRL